MVFPVIWRTLIISFFLRISSLVSLSMGWSSISNTSSSPSVGNLSRWLVMR